MELSLISCQFGYDSILDISIEQNRCGMIVLSMKGNIQSQRKTPDKS
jgi:hypothetical protein